MPAVRDDVHASFGYTEGMQPGLRVCSKGGGQNCSVRAMWGRFPPAAWEISHLLLDAVLDAGAEPLGEAKRALVAGWVRQAGGKRIPDRKG